MARFILMEQRKKRVKLWPLTPTQGKLMRRRYQKDAWDKEHLATISTRLNHEDMLAFRARCMELGISPYERLRHLIVTDTTRGKRGG